MAQVPPEMPDEPGVVVRDYPGRQVRVSYQASDEVATQVEMARIAVRALSAFGSGWWQPLSADQMLACCDPQTWYPVTQPEPPDRFRALYAADPPPGLLLQPAWEPTREEVTDHLTEATLLRWMTNRLDEPCPDDGGATVIGWQELLVRAARVRLAHALRPAHGSDLAIRSGAGVALVPLEIRDGAAWVSGPRPGRCDPPPVDLRVVHLSGQLTLEIGLHWSPWSDEAGASADQISESLQRLAALGWQALE